MNKEGPWGTLKNTDNADSPEQVRGYNMDKAIDYFDKQFDTLIEDWGLIGVSRQVHHPRPWNVGHYTLTGPTNKIEKLLPTARNAVKEVDTHFHTLNVGLRAEMTYEEGSENNGDSGIVIAFLSR